MFELSIKRSKILPRVRGASRAAEGVGSIGASLFVRASRDIRLNSSVRVIVRADVCRQKSAAAFCRLSKAVLIPLACLLCLTSVELIQAQSAAQQVSISQLSHVLVPGESIQIKVFQEPDLDTAVRIPGNGRVAFPLIGEVALAGETVQQATGLIRDRLGARFLVNPQVTITVLESAKRLFTVLGQVQRPGTYRFPEQQELDLLQVIGIAGGYTRLADPGSIIIKRRIDGSEKVLRVNGKRLARGDSAETFPIVSGDVITVGERLF